MGRRGGRRRSQIALGLPAGVYFAHPGSPWQRGSNENTNRPLLQCSPKRTDLFIDAHAALQAAEDQLNNRPRKMLQRQTAARVLTAGLTW